jgi:hypothetical protein
MKLNHFRCISNQFLSWIHSNQAWFTPKDQEKNLGPGPNLAYENTDIDHLSPKSNLPCISGIATNSTIAVWIGNAKIRPNWGIWPRYRNASHLSRLIASWVIPRSLRASSCK